MQLQAINSFTKVGSNKVTIHSANSKQSPNYRRNFVAYCSSENFGEQDRRNLLLNAAALTIAAPLALVQTAKADTELATYYGTASPPTSYGGYGGNAKEEAKYAFEYPSNWKIDTINKVQKGTQGIDSRVVNPRNKNQIAFVISLGRAGEDDKTFQLKDVESTFAGFAGADYDIQDAVSYATNKTTTERMLEGQKYIDYDIDSPDVRYLATITVKSGKVYAFFLKCPTKSFPENETLYRQMQASFRNV
eukprot:TRINITY_DN1929_c0_g1_i1.p2 TRINITY_DN1929_c0_g1~~TRINITY_DN1929_c0_g1_i1.p2  ORF type:complete len:248 (+),score=47.70 TRINITY_DN1929_c0_g1_i1:50-793(+)